MPGKRIGMLAALALVAGCTSPAHPSITEATTNHCARVPAHTMCQEWTPLYPQPSFADMMRLHTRSTAPNGVSWAALYFCGAIPGWEYRVILAKSSCAFYASNKSLRISIETLSVAAAAITVFPGEVRKHRTTVHGRDAVIREQTEHGTRHRYYLAIPGYPDQTIVADLKLPQPTRCVLDELTRTLVELSRPSG